MAVTLTMIVLPGNWVAFALRQPADQQHWNRSLASLWNESVPDFRSPGWPDSDSTCGSPDPLPAAGQLDQSSASDWPDPNSLAGQTAAAAKRPDPDLSAGWPGTNLWLLVVVAAAAGAVSSAVQHQCSVSYLLQSSPAVIILYNNKNDHDNNIIIMAITIMYAFTIMYALSSWVHSFWGNSVDMKWMNYSSTGSTGVDFRLVQGSELELTTSIVPWRNPDTRTIPKQTQKVTVPFGLRA